MSTQNYQNHAQRVPGFLAVGLAIFASFIGSLVNLYHSIGDHQRIYSASLLVVLTVSLFFVAFFCRTFALKAQDRAIRAEENLRHFAMTGKLLDPRLTMKQIIALRFASDAEFQPLIAEALAKNLDSKSIKMQVKNWRADFDRA
jgi:FtsH-binding integral membrane protein